MTTYLQHIDTGRDSIVSRLLNDPSTVDAANQEEVERVIKGMAITCYLGKRIESSRCLFSLTRHIVWRWNRYRK